MARGVMRGLGIVLLVAGLGLLGWVGWQYFGTGKDLFHSPDRSVAFGHLVKVSKRA